jgi:type IV pilus assembly protein PilM
MAERVLGLDVGTTAVRVVEVALDRPGGRGRPGRGLSITRVGEVPLPPGAVRDGEVVDPAAVGAAIAELWRQTGLRSRDVRLGLTGSRMVVRVVDMPSMPHDELAGAIRFSAADHIPIPLDEAVLDHAVLEEAPPGEPGGPPMVRVLIAAAHRSALDGLLAAVSAGGLRAVAVDLVPFALVRAFADAALDPAVDAGGDNRPYVPEHAEAIVSVGAGLTTVVVHERGRPRFVRTVPAGGDLLTTAISEELGIDLGTAEAAKRCGDIEGPEDDLARRAARVVELRLAGILGEIQSSLAYWVAQADRPLRRIVLTGGGARAGDLAGRLALLVGAPVEWGATRGVEAPERAAGVGEWPDLAVAAGIALGANADGSGIDLCPPVKRSLRLTGEMARRLAVAAVVVAVLGGGLSVRSVLAVGKEKSRLAAQKKVNARVQAEMAAFDSLRRLSTDLDVGRKTVQGALAGDVAWTRFLEELARSMPSGVWLKTMNAQAAPAGRPAGGSAGKAAAPAGAAAGATGGIGSLQISATGLDYPAVAEWLQKIEAQPALAGVAVSGVTAGGTGTTVDFASTVTITESARSDRASKLAKAAL